LPTKFTTIDGTAVHYLHTGATTLPGEPPALADGRLLLLVHAAGSNAGMWRRQLEGLPGHSMVVPDLPGHGRSGGLDGLASVEEYAAFLARFAQALRLRPFVLVGRSMGGAIGLEVASRYPERLAGLVLVCSAARFTFTPAQLEGLRNVVRGRAPQQFTTETFSPETSLDLMREAWMEQVKTDPRVRWTDMLACQAFDGRALLARIRTPTLVIAGADDQVTPPALGEALAQGIPGARLHVVAAAGHQAPLEQTTEFNRVVTAFVEGLP